MKNNIVIKYTAPSTIATTPDTIFLNAENVIINKSLEELSYITLSTQDKSVAVQGTIEYDGQIFEVSEVTKADNGMYEVYAVQDVRELKAALRRSIYYTGVTAATAIQRAMTNNHTADSNDTIASDWQFVPVDNVTRKRDIDLDYTTFWNALMEIRDIWHVELEIDTKLKKIKLYSDRSRGKKLDEQTSQFHLYEGVNISDLELSYDGDTFHNIIQGYGQKTTKNTDKEWITYISSKNLKASDGLPARTVYYNSAVQSSDTAVARKWTAADPNSSDPDSKVTMIQKKVGGIWSDANKYYASSRSYDSDGDIVPSTGDQNSIVKTIVTSFTEKKNKIWKTTQTTKLLRASDANDVLRDWVFSTYGFEFTGSTIYCYDYTNFKNRAYLYNDKYDDVEALVEDMCLYLRESYQPKASVKITLAQLPGDYRNDLSVGDTVVVHPKEGTKLTMRVLSMQYDVAHPDNTTIELGTRKKSLADSQAMQKRFNNKNISTTGSLTSAATNNVRSYVNSSNITEQIVSGSFVSEEELAEVLDLQNSRMIIQNIDASAINTGTLDASLINVKDLSTENINLTSLNGHDIREGTLLARFLDDLIISNGGANGNVNAHNIWCNAEDMREHMNPTSEKYISFVDGDLWWESNVLSTRTEKTTLWKYDTQRRDEQTQAIIKYHHPELDDTFWWPRQWDSEDLAAKSITADHISVGSINGNAIESGCLVSKDFYLGGLRQPDETVTDWGLRYLASSNSLDAKLNSLDISTTTDSELNMWNRTGSLVGSQMKPTVVRVGDIGLDNKVKDNGMRTELKWDGIHIYDGTTEVGKLYMYNSSPTYKSRLMVNDIEASDTVTASGKIYASQFVLPRGNALQSGTTSSAVPLIWLASTGSVIHLSNSSYQYPTKVEGAMEIAGALTLDTLPTTTTTSTSSTTYPILRVNSSGKVYKYGSSSSKRFKHDIKPIANHNSLYDLNVVEFKFNEDYLDKEDERCNKDIPGFIVEQMEEVFPIAVNHDHDGRPNDWDVNMIAAASLKLIQEQKKQLDDQQKQIDALKARLDVLESKS